MRILLDTHAFLWWITDHPKLSDQARNVITNTENEIYLSAASCWEIVIQAKLGRLELPEKLHIFIPEQLHINHFLSLPILISHALAVYQLPKLHNDPFDRILIAQARADKLSILTTDSLISKYGVDVIW